jgi:3-oxoadipate enol-lactonase
MSPHGEVLRPAAGAPLLGHRVDGTGAPVLLLNGGLMSYPAWGEVAEALARSHRVVRCDFRGQLLSPGEPPASLDGHAADVVTLLDHFGMNAVHVVGTSFGALVGVALAAERPERVRSLALVTATDHLDAALSEEARALRQACQVAASGGDGGAVLDVLAPLTFSAAWREANASALAQRRQQIAALPGAWFQALERLLAVLEGLDLRSRLGRVRCPALVVAAAEDATFPLERSLALAAGLPDATLEVVAGSGHALVVERPTRLVEILRTFLARAGSAGPEGGPS